MLTHEKQGFEDGGWDRWRRMKTEKKDKNGKLAQQ